MRKLFFSLIFLLILANIGFSAVQKMPIEINATSPSNNIATVQIWNWGNREVEVFSYGFYCKNYSGSVSPFSTISSNSMVEREVSWISENLTGDWNYTNNSKLVNPSYCNDGDFSTSCADELNALGERTDIYTIYENYTFPYQVQKIEVITKMASGYCHASIQVYNYNTGNWVEFATHENSSTSNDTFTITDINSYFQNNLLQIRTNVTSWTACHYYEQLAKFYINCSDSSDYSFWVYTDSGNITCEGSNCVSLLDEDNIYILNLSKSTNWVSYFEKYDNQSRSSWNESFTGNKTFWLSIPIKSTVTSSKLNLKGLRDNTTGSCSDSTCVAPSPSNTYYWSCSYYVKGRTCKKSHSSYDAENYLSATAGSSSCSDTDCVEPGTYFTCPPNYWTCTGSQYNCSKGDTYTVSTDARYRLWNSNDGTCSGSYQDWNSLPDYSLVKMSWNYWWNTTNPWLDTANSDYPWEWNVSGEFYEDNGTVEVDLNKTLINNYLSSCSSNLCDVPIKLHSDTAGKIQVSNIEIFYDYNISELYSKTSDTYYVEAGKNITRTINLNHSDKASPVNFTYNGVYWPSDGGVLPLSCEVDGTAKTFENGYCSFTESISSGNYFTNHSIKFYKGVLVNKSQVEGIWNDTIVVDKSALVYFNVTACNNDNIGYSNILVRADLPSIYSNVTPYIFYDTINNGSCSRHSFINATGIPVVETSFTGPDIITLPEYYKYTYTFTLNVRDGNVSSKNITYLVLKSDLMDFGKRDPTMDLVRVDGNSTGVYSEDYGDYYRINITTEHGYSSLEEGTHSGEIIYYVPITGEPSPSPGGGGGGEANYMVVRPMELFIPIYDECNSTLLNITWYGQPEITASILISDEIKDYILQPKSGDKILLKNGQTTILPIKACVPDELKQELMEALEKGISGTIEIRATTKYGSIVSQTVPVEIRKYAIEVVKPAKPTPKPKPSPITADKIFRVILFILIIALAAKFLFK